MNQPRRSGYVSTKTHGGRCCRSFWTIFGQAAFTTSVNNQRRPRPPGDVGSLEPYSDILAETTDTGLFVKCLLSRATAFTRGFQPSGLAPLSLVGHRVLVITQVHPESAGSCQSRPDNIKLERELSFRKGSKHACAHRRRVLVCGAGTLVLARCGSLAHSSDPPPWEALSAPASFPVPGIAPLCLPSDASISVKQRGPQTEHRNRKASHSPCNCLRSRESYGRC